MKQKKINFLRNFTLLFIFTGFSFSALILSVVFFELDRQYHKINIERVNILHQSREDKINNTYFYYTKFISSIEQNRFFLEYLTDSQNKIKKENLATLFEAIVTTENEISQLRYIDENGFEKIRLSRKDLFDNIYSIKEENLQNKSHRDYFKNTKALTNQIIVSKIDLNIENNEIQKPIKPVWRFTKAIYVNHEFKGIIAINIFTEKLLNTIITSDNFNIDLFDQDGKILVSSDAKQNSWERYLNVNNPKKNYFKTKLLIDERNGEKLYLGYNTKVNVIKFFDFLKIEMIFILFIVTILSFILAYFIAKIPLKLFNDLEKNQKILIQQSRLSAMGEMIANIAHQWRQPLNRINLSTNVIKSLFENNKNNFQGEDIEFFENKFKQVDKNIQYMSRTINDFTEYLTPNKNREEFYLCALVKKTINIVKDRATQINIINNVKINTKAFGIENEMMQVVLVLLENAVDKLINSNQSDKTIKISSVDLKNQILLSIEDNGEAIPEEIIDRIFEPYFTTKESKQGSGLGLYMAKMIIKDSFLGNLEVSSLKKKTTFKIFIPKGIDA